MKPTTILKRLALIPLAYATALGACGDPGANEPPGSDPGTTQLAEPALIDPALMTQSRSPYEPQPAREVAAPTRLAPEPFGRLDEIPLVLRMPPLIITSVVVEPVETGDGGTECADAGTVEDAGTSICTGSGKLCKGACVYLDGDLLNCGACGIVCGAGTSCHRGQCTPK